MKKIKLLTPILGLTLISSTLVPLTSCKTEDKGEITPTITTYDNISCKCSKIELNKEFKITTTCADGYGIGKVVIVVGGHNLVETKDYDIEENVITVNAKAVTSRDIKIMVNASEKIEALTEEEWIAAFDAIDYTKRTDCNYTYNCVDGLTALSEKKYELLISNRKIIHREYQNDQLSEENFYKVDENQPIKIYYHGLREGYVKTIDFDMVDEVIEDNLLPYFRPSFNLFTFYKETGEYIDSSNTYHIKFNNKKQLISVEWTGISMKFTNYGTTDADKGFIKEESIVDNWIENDNNLNCFIGDDVLADTEYVAVYDVEGKTLTNQPTLTFSTDTASIDFKNSLIVDCCFIAADGKTIAEDVDPTENPPFTWNNNVLTFNAGAIPSGTKKIYVDYFTRKRLANVNIKLTL